MENKNYAERFEAAKTTNELLLFREELRKDYEDNQGWDDPTSPKLAACQNASYYIRLVEQKVSELITESKIPNQPISLTKREYFAAMAMQSVIQAESEASVSSVKTELGLSESEQYVFNTHYPQYISKLSIMYADELLKQLANP